MATFTAIFTEDTGQTLYAFPISVSLSTWLTNRSACTEGTAPNLGKYSVTVTDSNGCTETITHPVTVLPSDTLFPNVFSPNGDGINDILLFKLPPVETYDLKIFDRWGKLIFYSNTVSTSWEGMLNGHPCPDGVYFYLLTATLPNEKGVIHRTDNVTLLR